MATKSLTISIVLALTLVVTAGRADEDSKAENVKLRAKIQELETANQTLKDEVARLKGILYKIPETKPDEARLNKDLGALTNLYKALKEKPEDKEMLKEAGALAKRLGPYAPGNSLVWHTLLSTRTLKDGLTLAEAFVLLGPPSDLSNEYVGWYFNPRGRHVAPYLHAKITKDGLADWKIGSR
jgi:hypothetical protein